MKQNRHIGGEAFSPNYHPACGCRSAFGWKELLVVIAVLGLLIVLFLPAVESSREAARRATCTNRLRQIGIALLNYSQAKGGLPPGTICTSAPTQPVSQYDVLSEAGKTEAGPQGTSFLLAALPFFDSDDLYKSWNFRAGLSSTKKTASSPSNYELANTDIGGLYCPSRRSCLRPEDRPMMLSPSWTGGGTDYGGCAGRHAAFTLKTGYNLCDATMYYEPNFFPSPFSSPLKKGTGTSQPGSSRDDLAAEFGASPALQPDKTQDTFDKRWGIFGRVNRSTTLKEISDGTSHTIMMGELQRITDWSPTSKDGWAIGGPATLFTTGAMVVAKPSEPGRLAIHEVAADGELLNNHFFGSPGSEHPSGAIFGIADGSARLIHAAIDPNVFALLGSMADGVAVDIDSAIVAKKSP